MAFEYLPQELKQYNSWILWRLENKEGKLIKRPVSPITKRPIDITDNKNYCAFDVAVNAIDEYHRLGFALSDNDPFTFVDLDDSKGDAEILKKQIDISNWFDSYQERSPSGKGLHIIIKGSVGKGINTKIAEIYSKDRFMTITGDCYKHMDIRDYNNDINSLKQYLKPDKETVNIPDYSNYVPTFTDEELYYKCRDAANGQKFLDLFAGEWKQYYKSQSEADLSLINILAFYTKDREQITRLFYYSKLGERKKAKRANYINDMLDKCFDNDMSLETVEKYIDTNKQLLEKQKENKMKSKLQLPDGLIGEIAQYIYEQSPRPVLEASITAAIGLMAGITGRSYNVSGIGLNQYLLITNRDELNPPALPESNDIVHISNVNGEMTVTDYLGNIEKLGTANNPLECDPESIIINDGFIYNSHVAENPKLCNGDWRVPRQLDFQELIDYLISIGCNYDDTFSGNKIAKAMASEIQGNWQTSTEVGSVGNADFPDKRNITKLNIKGAGLR